MAFKECPRQDLVHDLIDGELSPTETAEMSQHLQTCPVCRREREELLQLRQVAEALNVDRVAEKRIAQALADELDPASQSVSQGALRVPWPVAAGVLLLLALSLLWNFYLLGRGQGQAIAEMERTAFESRMITRPDGQEDLHIELRDSSDFRLLAKPIVSVLRTRSQSEY